MARRKQVQGVVMAAVAAAAPVGDPAMARATRLWLQAYEARDADLLAVANVAIQALTQPPQATTPAQALSPAAPRPTAKRPEWLNDDGTEKPMTDAEKSDMARAIQEGVNKKAAEDREWFVETVREAQAQGQAEVRVSASRTLPDVKNVLGAAGIHCNDFSMTPFPLPSSMADKVQGWVYTFRW